MRVCIVGYGNIAKKHIEVFQSQGATIVASCNRSEINNNLARQEAGIENTYTDVHEMIKKMKPDAIIVCVSTENIFNVTKELITTYRIPLLVEKPPGTSLQELNQLIELKNKYQVCVQVAVNRRHYSVIKNAITDMGGIDKITTVSIEWSENPDRAIKEKGYTFEKTSKLIYANSIHGIDTLIYLGGKLVNPTLITKNLDNRLRCHMSVVGISDQDKLLSFSSSWDNPVPWRIVITAENKRYVFAPLETCNVSDIKGNHYNIEPDENDKRFKAGFYEQAKHFIEISKNKSVKHHHDLDSCSNAMEISEKIYNKLFSVR